MQKAPLENMRERLLHGTVSGKKRKLKNDEGICDAVRKSDEQWQKRRLAERTDQEFGRTDTLRQEQALARTCSPP